jgi:hypothetical protein
MWLLPALRCGARLPLAGAAHATDAGRGPGRRAPARLTGRPGQGGLRRRLRRGGAFWGWVRGAGPDAAASRRPGRRSSLLEPSAEGDALVLLRLNPPQRRTRPPGRTLAPGPTLAPPRPTLAVPRRRTRRHRPRHPYPAQETTAPSATARRPPGSAGCGEHRDPELHAGRLGCGVGSPEIDAGARRGAVGIRGSAEPPPRWRQRPIARERHSRSTCRAASAAVWGSRVERRSRRRGIPSAGVAWNACGSIPPRTERRGDAFDLLLLIRAEGRTRRRHPPSPCDGARPAATAHATLTQPKKRRREHPAGGDVPGAGHGPPRLARPRR